MAPPPVTPSPHRFLVKQKKSQQDSQKTQTPDPSAKRTPIPPITPNSAASSRAVGHSSHETLKPSTAARAQFAPTPRFGFARPPSSKRPRLTQEKHELHFQTPLRFRDDHEENSIEEDDDFNEINQEDDGHEARVARPQFLPTLAPVTANEEVHDDSDAIMSDTQLPSHHRPAFLQPTAIAPAQQAEPLPEVFSPHRRGQKFVPGGMAIEMREWILNIAQTSSKVSKAMMSTGRSVHFEVLQARGTVVAGVILVKAKADDLRIHLALACAGQRRSSHPVLDAGDVIAVNSPTWEIMLEGCTWTVVADWHILARGPPV